jgi:hypothetical protein
MKINKEVFKVFPIGCGGLLAVLFAFLLYRFLINPILTQNWNYFIPEPSCHPLNDSIENADPISNSEYQKTVMRIMENSTPNDFRYYFKDTIGSDERYMK